MKQYKTHPLVMLPTDKESYLFLNKKKNELFLNEQMDESSPLCQAQHLYILSDEPIKEGELKKGDWYYSPVHNRLFQCIHNDEQFELERKIIATTDNSLKRDCNCSILCTGVCDKKLSKLSQDFIKYYIEQYNLGNKIEFVEVEVEIY